MSLTLNDEQEKALRGFAAAWRPDVQAVSVREKEAAHRLYVAIAPLMKPWRCERGSVIGWLLTGPNGASVSVAPCVPGGDKDANRAMVEHICDLLNAEEAR